MCCQSSKVIFVDPHFYQVQLLFFLGLFSNWFSGPMARMRHQPGNSSQSCTWKPSLQSCPCHRCVWKQLSPSARHTEKGRHCSCRQIYISRFFLHKRSGQNIVKLWFYGFSAWLFGHRKKKKKKKKNIKHIAFRRSATKGGLVARQCPTMWRWQLPREHSSNREKKRTFYKKRHWGF